jgi:hypothetical protein
LGWHSLISFVFQAPEEDEAKYRTPPECEREITAAHALEIACYASFQYKADFERFAESKHPNYDENEDKYERQASSNFECSQTMVDWDKAETAAKGKIPPAAEFQLGYVHDAGIEFVSARTQGELDTTRDKFTKAIDAFRHSCRVKITTAG